MSISGSPDDCTRNDATEESSKLPRLHELVSEKTVRYWFAIGELSPSVRASFATLRAVFGPRWFIFQKLCHFLCWIRRSSACLYLRGGVVGVSSNMCREGEEVEKLVLWHSYRCLLPLIFTFIQYYLDVTAHLSICFPVPHGSSQSLVSQRLDETKSLTNYIQRGLTICSRRSINMPVVV